MAKRGKFDLDQLKTAYVEPDVVFKDEEDQKDEISLFVDICEDDQLEELYERTRVFFEAEQSRIQDELPYAEDEGWFWVVNSYCKEDDKCIWAVLTLLFGSFLRKCFGTLDDSGAFVPVEVFLPRGITYPKIVHRLACKPFHANPTNRAVYNQFQTIDMSKCIAVFVNMIKRFGYFSEGEANSFCPPRLFDDAATKIAIRVLGDQNSEPSPTSGLLPALGFGSRYVKAPRRRQWAINGAILMIPDPISRQDWEKHVYVRPQEPGETDEHYEEYQDSIRTSREEHIGQVHLVLPEEDQMPCIPSGRHFTDVDAERFGDLFKIVNGSVRVFVDKKCDGTSDYDMQQWVSALCVDLMHEYAPNFMSYIGAQYLQRICVEHQAPRYRDVSPGAPRAYFSRKTDDKGRLIYRDSITPGEERVVASFVEVFGSMFFSHITYTSAFVGEGGTGKNLLRHLAVKIVGGFRHTFRIDNRHNNFALEALNSGVFLMICEDATDQQTTIPSELMDSTIGGKRGVKRDTANIEAKFGRRDQELMEPLGCYYARNEATDDARTLKGKSKQEKIHATVAGSSSNKIRRSRPAPPLMQRLTEGSVNPVDEENNLAFDETAMEKVEIPYIILVCWVTTVLGDLVRDDLYGLVGEGGNSELDELNRRYLAMNSHDASSNLKRIIEEAPSYNFSCSNQRIITYTSSVTFKEIQKQYAKTFKNSTLKSLPEEYPVCEARLWRCRDCGMSISGIKDFSGIPAAHASCTADDRDRMLSKCPMDNTPCFQKMVRGSKVLKGYRFIVQE